MFQLTGSESLSTALRNTALAINSRSKDKRLLKFNKTLFQQNIQTWLQRRQYGLLFEINILNNKKKFQKLKWITIAPGQTLADAHPRHKVYYCGEKPRTWKYSLL